LEFHPPCRGRLAVKQFGPDGRLEKTSQQHSVYGKALIDALRHGFSPSADDYSVDLPHGRLHYPPGRDPEYTSGLSPPKRRRRTAWTELERLDSRDRNGRSSR